MSFVCSQTIFQNELMKIGPVQSGDDCVSYLLVTFSTRLHIYLRMIRNCCAGAISFLLWNANNGADVFPRFSFDTQRTARITFLIIYQSLLSCAFSFYKQLWP